VAQFAPGLKLVQYRGPPKPYSEAAAGSLVAELKAAELVLSDLATMRTENHFRHAQESGRSKRRTFVSPLFETVWRRVVVDEVQDVEGQVRRPSYVRAVGGVAEC